MKMLQTLTLIFLVSLFNISQTFAAEETPTEVYAQYISTVQIMDSMETRPFEKFISTRAKEVVAKKMNKIKTSQYNAFLDFWKKEAIALPKEGVNTQTDKNSAEISYTLSDTPQAGSTQKTQIVFIKEDGWKIDKIVRGTSGADFNFKSTTF